MLGFSQKIKNIWQYMGLPSQWQHQATVRNSCSFGPCLCPLVCHSLHSPCCILLTSSLADLVCLAASASIFVCDLWIPSQHLLPPFRTFCFYPNPSFTYLTPTFPSRLSRRAPSLTSLCFQVHYFAPSL